DRPFFDAAVGPHLGGDGVEVFGEVAGGARLVGAVHRDDLEVGEFHSGVRGGDLRVVPVGDLAGEDLRDRFPLEVEVLGVEVEVVHDRDGRDVQGELECFGAEATLGCGGTFVLVQCGVRTGELDRAVEELFSSRARARRVVGNRAVGAFGEPGDPGDCGVLLGGGARAPDLAAEFRTVGGVGRSVRRRLPAVVCRAAGGHRGEPGGGREGAEPANRSNAHSSLPYLFVAVAF